MDERSGDAAGTGVSSVPFVSAQHIRKSYGGVPVLKDVSLDFVAGRIHGLIGENGAGKSTLTKIMAGMVGADGGTVVVDGVPMHLGSTRAALERGITMISQERAIAGKQSVLDNVFLGRLGTRFGVVQRRAALRRFQELTERVGFAGLDPNGLAGDLPPAKQQQIEVLRALATNARMVIMDEPTAVLTAHESEQLQRLARTLAAQGTAIIFISHLLDEVLAICDRISVLRDGELVMSGTPEGQTPATLVSAMVGRSLEALYAPPAAITDQSRVVLRVTGLRRGNAVRGVDLEVRRGEIVGLAGLIGSGRSEVARLIFGADTADAGEVWIDGRRLNAGSPRDAMQAGVAMIPESRKEQGLLLGRTVRENVSLASLPSLSTARVVRSGRESAALTPLLQRLQVRGGTLDSPVWTLSGGNQQKVLFARWLLRNPVLLIADEPTRGIDVAAKVHVHQVLRELAAEGTAILLISSEIEEVMALSHRLYVFRQGQVSAQFERETATREEVLAAAFQDPVGSRR